MAQPTPYVRDYSFTDHTTDFPTIPQPGDKIDAELDALQETTDEIINNLGLIQRDDGALRNGIVTADSLAESISTGLGAPSAWLTATDYIVDNSVAINNKFYKCTAAHTSGIFATDLAAGDWVLLIDFTTLFGAAVTSLDTLTPAADRQAYYTGASSSALSVLTSFGRSINGSADAAAAKIILGLTIGTDVQAWDADLDTWAAKTPPSGTVIGTTDSQALTNKTINAASNTVSNIAVSMFAANVADTDNTLTANSDTRLATQKAIKAYVDNLVTGLSWKAKVRAATTANGALASAFANGQTIDGVSLVTGDRILLKNQSAPAENGIYVVAASGAPARASDADTGAELVNATVMVSEGTTLADTQWTCSTNATITIDSTSLTFAQIAGAGTYTNGSGITLTGNAFSISATYVGQSTITTLGTIATGVWNGTIITSAYGGTGNGFTKFSGPASSEKTFTLPNASDTISCLGQQNLYTKQQNVQIATLTDAASVTWDMSTQANAKVTLGGNRTMAAPSNLVEGATYKLRVIQDGTGSRTLAYNAVYKFPGGTTPTLSTGAAAVDILTFDTDGTNLYGVIQKNFA